MKSHIYSTVADQISALQEEFDATRNQFSHTLFQRVGSLNELAESVTAIRNAELTDDEEHLVMDAAYDNYGCVIEDLKEKIQDAVGNVDDHMKMCADLRSVLEQVAFEAWKPLS